MKGQGVVADGVSMTDAETHAHASLSPVLLVAAGVRNAQARNIMRGMQLGDQILFYYSSCKVPGIIGIAEVAKLAYPDHTAWDPKSKYFDASRCVGWQL